MALLLTETYLALLQLLRDVRFVLEMHANVILYLIPVFLIWPGSKRAPCAHLMPDRGPTQSISLIVGVFIHEPRICSSGVLTSAKPVAMSIIPRHIDKGCYEPGMFGSRTFDGSTAFSSAWRPAWIVALLFSFTGDTNRMGFHGGISSLGMFSRKSP